MKSQYLICDYLYNQILLSCKFNYNNHCSNVNNQMIRYDCQLYGYSPYYNKIPFPYLHEYFITEGY